MMQGMFLFIVYFLNVLGKFSQMKFKAGDFLCITGKIFKVAIHVTISQ